MMDTKGMVIGLLAIAVAGAGVFAVSGDTVFLSSDGAIVGAKVAAAAVIGGYIGKWAGGSSWNY
jgi:hypothetical protein